MLELLKETATDLPCEEPIKLPVQSRCLVGMQLWDRLSSILLGLGHSDKYNLSSEIGILEEAIPKNPF